jgi:hypothetical protein
VVRAVRDGGVVELLVDLVRLCVQLARHGGTPDPPARPTSRTPATLPRPPRPPLTRLSAVPSGSAVLPGPAHPRDSRAAHHRPGGGAGAGSRAGWPRSCAGSSSAARLAGPSLPLDVGYSDDVPAAIRNAVRLRDKHCQWAGGYFLQRIERAIGQLAVSDFVTPPPAIFVRGCGQVTLAAYTRWYPEKKSERKGIIAHTRTVSTNGCRVEVCLFGSIENCADYLSAGDAEAPTWSSSSTWSIEEFITNRGTKPAPIYDDDESIAVEILRVFNNEGMTGKYVFNRPTTAEWFAEVYKDVELDKKRWNLRPGEDLPEPVDRIVIGQPLWIRSSNG